MRGVLLLVAYLTLTISWAPPSPLPLCGVGFPRLIGMDNWNTYPVSLDYFPGTFELATDLTPEPGTDKVAVTGYIDNYLN
jgi:hypothetical protein